MNRLPASVDFGKAIVWIKWIGTHRAYDGIDAREVRHERDLRPIRTEADHEAALAEVERLWGAKLGTPEGDRLDILATLIDAYEGRHHSLDPPDPIETIRFRMEQSGLTPLDLEPLIGSRPDVTKLLEREIDLSLDHIRRLHAEWGIPADILIRPSRLRQVA